MLKLFAIQFSLLIHFSVHSEVHVDVFHLPTQVVEYLSIFLDDPLIGSHVVLDPLKQLLVLIFSTIHDKKEFAYLLCLHHRHLIMNEDRFAVSKLLLHLCHLTCNKLLATLYHLVAALVLLLRHTVLIDISFYLFFN